MSGLHRLPIATLILIVANLATAFALLWYPDLIFQFGFEPAHPHLQTAFTSLFLHANLFHLLANMVFLAAVGVAVELATGTLRFVVVYFASGLGGVVLHLLLAAKSPFEPHPLVGASGCIAGCAAYYGIRYLNLRVPLAPKVGVPVVAIVVGWVVLQVLGGVKAIGDPAAANAYWAHLGGLLAGIVLSLVFRAPDPGRLRLGHEVLERMNQRGPAAAAAAALRHLEAHPRDPVALRQLVEAHRLMDDATSEADALVKLTELLPDEELGLPLLRLGELAELGRFSPIQRMRMAERVAPSSPEAARGLYQDVIASEDSQRPEALLALAALERAHNPDDAQAALARLAQEYPLHPSTEIARARGWMS